MKSRISVRHLIFLYAMRGAVRAADRLRRDWPAALLCLAMLAAGAVWLTSVVSARTWAWKSLERLFGSPAQSADASSAATQAHADASGTNGLNITSFDDPSAGTSTLEGTLGTAINSSGEVTGMYSNSMGVVHGFIRTASGVITNFDAPGAGSSPPTGSAQGTIPTAIDTAGDVAGVYIDANNAYHSFLRTSDGTITEFDAPGASSAANRGTSPMAMNDAGEIVGFFTTGSLETSSVYHGFVRGANGAITTIDVPGAGSGESPIGKKQGTTAGVINASGEIAGSYVDANNKRHGFVLLTNGTYTTFDPTGSTSSTATGGGLSGTEVFGIDSAGDVVGAYTDSNLVRHGYTRSASGAITAFDVPGANTTSASGSIGGTLPLGIDPGGNTVVGLYADSNGLNHGFAYSQPLSGSGTFTSISAPNAGTTATLFVSGTGAIGVNPSGEVVGGYLDSNNVGHGFVLTLTTQAIAATPTFSPPAGTYTGTQTVTISDVTPGATIYYTTDGTTPTTSSTAYDGPIKVSLSETIEAIATASGYTDSTVAVGAYIINGIPVAATPTFSPPSGTYASAQTVTISDTTPGAKIYYTTNGSTPTTGSTLYVAPLAASSSETIEAIAAAPGYVSSAVAQATYIITSQGGQSTTIYTYKGNDYGTVSGVTCGGSYCTGGPYALTVRFTTTLTGSVLDNLPFTDITSTVTSFNLTDGSGLVDDSSSADYKSFQIATDGSGNIVSWLIETCGNTCNIQMQTNWDTYYSFHPGADFSETTANFAGNFGFVSDNPGSWTQTMGPPTQTSAPTFSPAGGTYSSAQTVAITDATPGATIYFTTNGTTPTTSSTVYSGPIRVSSSETIEAIATATGYATSAVTSAAYAINIPGFGPPSGSQPGSISIQPGATTGNTAAISVVGTNGFSGTVNLTCAIAPIAANDPPTCSLLPISVTLSGTTAQTSTLTVSTTAPTSADGRPTWQQAAGAAFALVLLLAIPRRKLGWPAMPILLAIVVSVGILACGGGNGSSHGSGSSGTTPGSYTVTVTGASGSISATIATVNLTVQ